MFHPKVESWPYPQTIDLAGKACQGQTPKLNTKIVNYGQKSFSTLGHGHYNPKKDPINYFTIVNGVLSDSDSSIN